MSETNQMPLLTLNTPAPKAEETAAASIQQTTATAPAAPEASPGWMTAS